MRRIIFFFSLLLVVATFPAFAVSPDLFHDQLSNVQDLSLRKTLENSISIGLIADKEELERAITRAEKIKNNLNPIAYSARSSHSSVDYKKISQEISTLAGKIKSLDKDAIKVIKEDSFKGRRLFKDITCKIPDSYKKAFSLTKLFNPRHGTNDAIKLSKQINGFLISIADDPTIKYALKSTNTTIQDLRSNWFGAGLGFEHVVCGELKGSKVSGYHWWYKFYKDERRDYAQVTKALSDAGDPCVFTGKFTWDPDGKNGPLPCATKRKGGFLVGNSVQAILALGHIAIETAKKYNNGHAPSAFRFSANINGEAFNWQVYTVGNSIRSLYPMGKKNSSKIFQSENYYDLEEGSALAIIKGNNTTH